MANASSPLPPLPQTTVQGNAWSRGIWPMTLKVFRQESQGWIMEVITSLAYPLTFLLAFGLGLRGTIPEVMGVPYATFLMPGLIGYTLLMEAFSLSAWGLWLDRWHLGMLDEARIKPVTANSLLLGQLLGVAIVASIKGSITALVLWSILGLWPNFWHLLLFKLYLVPGIVLFMCLGSIVGLSFKKPDHIAQSMTILVMPALYLGGLFFPVSGLPGWLQPIVAWLPTTVFFEGGRKALLFGQWQADSLLFVWALAVVAFLATVRTFHNRLSKG